MSKEIAPTNGNLPVDPFEQYGQEVASLAHITGDLLRFTKHGEWKAGQNQDTLEDGTRMLVYMPSLKKGWVKWSDGQPTQHIIGLVAEAYNPPKREDLGDLDENEWEQLSGKPVDPWQFTNYVVMCDQDGQMYTYVTASKGGLNAVGLLSTSFGRRRRMKPDEIPVIELHSRSYIHKDYGETFAPDLKIAGWAKIPENFTELSSAIENDVNDTLIEDMRPTKPVKAAPAKVKPPVKTPPSKGKGSRSVRF